MNTVLNAHKRLKLHHIALFALIGIGFFLRIWDLAAQSLWMDEGFTINGVRAVLAHGYPLSESGIVLGLSTSFHFYFTAIFVSLFGESEFWYRFPSVIIGVAVIPLTYYLFSIIYSKRVGLISAFIMTFSYWAISWGRQARYPVLLQLLFLASLVLFFLVFEKKKVNLLFFLGLTTAFTLFTKQFGYSLFLIFFSYSLYRRKKVMKLLKKIRKRFRLRWHLALAWSLLAAFFAGLFILTLQGISEWNLNHHHFVGYITYLYHYQFLFLSLGIIGLLVSYRNHKKAAVLLFLSYLMPLLLFSIGTTLFHYRYLFFLFPILAGLTAYSIDFLLRKISANPIIQSIIGSALIAFCFFLPAFVFLPISHYQLEPFTPQPDFAHAYSSVAANMQEDDLIISTLSPLSNYYLGRNDYWLSFSLSGRPGTDLSFDRYSSSPAIMDEQEFLRVTEGESGWIIADIFSLKRMDEGLALAINRTSIVEQATVIDDDISGVYVFRFQND